MVRSEWSQPFLARVDLKVEVGPAITQGRTRGAVVAKDAKTPSWFGTVGFEHRQFPLRGGQFRVYRELRSCGGVNDQDSPTTSDKLTVAPAQSVEADGLRVTVAPYAVAISPAGIKAGNS